MSISERFHGPRFWSFVNINIMSRSRLSYTRINTTLRHQYIVGSINGLVCLVYGVMFLLWNPVTGLGKTVSPPQSYWNDKLLNKMFHGLSWDHLENEYKVVLCYRGEKSLPVIVYGSNSDSWSGLVVLDTFVGKHFMPNPAVIVKGCPYWTARDGTWTPGSGYGGFVVKFESESSQFKEFVLPSQITRRECYNVVNVEDRLVVMAYYQMSGTNVHVFHLDEECGDWIKTYTFEPIDVFLNEFLLCFKYGGEIVCNNANRLYDPKTNEIKVIGDGYCDHKSGCSYTPSLVFLQGMERLHTQSFWRSPEVENSALAPTQSHLRLLLSKYFECFRFYY